MCPLPFHCLTECYFSQLPQSCRKWCNHYIHYCRGVSCSCVSVRGGAFWSVVLQAWNVGQIPNPQNSLPLKTQGAPTLTDACSRPKGLIDPSSPSLLSRYHSYSTREGTNSYAIQIERRIWQISNKLYCVGYMKRREVVCECVWAREQIWQSWRVFDSLDGAWPKRFY